MRNLVLPSIDPHEVLDDIIDAKRGARLNRLRLVASQLHNRFDEYETTKYSLEHLIEQSWEETECNDLYHCYNDSTNPLNTLKYEIKKAQPQICRRVCQYCGLNTVTNIFDHYLPKKSFPEYAVYGFNLIPCCSECNGKKSEIFLRNGTRQFVNLYYDNLPQEKYLCVCILEHKEELMAEYYLDSSVSQLIQNHYTNLNLLARFAEAAPEVFSEIRTSISKFEIASLNDVLLLISKQAECLKVKHSNNHWQAVLYEQLLAEPDKLQQLIY